MSFDDILYRLGVVLADAGVYGLLALGLGVAFRVVRFPDLTAEGSFVFGAVGSYLAGKLGAPMIVIVAVACAFGALAGVVTAGLSVVARVPSILCGILTWMALYTVNLHLLGSPNAQIARERMIGGPSENVGLALSAARPAIIIIGVFIVSSCALWCILESRAGLRLRCVSTNPYMASSIGIPTNGYTFLGLGIANGLVGLAGGLFSSKAGYVDVNMGSGMLVAGIAPLFLGSSLFSSSRSAVLIAICIVGAILYRGIISVALELGLDPKDIRLSTAVLVLVGLAISRLRRQRPVGMDLEQMLRK